MKHFENLPAPHMHANSNSAWQASKLPTAEELVEKALKVSQKFSGARDALFEIMSYNGIFNAGLHLKALALLQKQLGEKPILVQTHASCSAEALERLEDSRPVFVESN